MDDECPANFWMGRHDKDVTTLLTNSDDGFANGKYIFK